MTDLGRITENLPDWDEENQPALEELMPLVYDELRKQASRYLRRERQNHTLQTTALIHEAFIKLVEQKNLKIKNELHFYAISANLMRRILVDHARAKNAEKRGGDAKTLQINEEIIVRQDARSVDLIALDEALDRLKTFDERQARTVELRYFSGLSLEETAEVMNVSRTTVANEWAMAKAWLYRELTK